jgi:hypothetical protein
LFLKNVYQMRVWLDLFVPCKRDIQEDTRDVICSLDGKFVSRITPRSLATADDRICFPKSERRTFFENFSFLMQNFNVNIMEHLKISFSFIHSFIQTKLFSSTWSILYSLVIFEKDVLFRKIDLVICHLIVDFVSLFNARFPSSLQTCQLHFQVQILGVNFATKIASTFQCLNYCKRLFIVQVEINNSMESSWSSGLPRRFVFYWIGYYYWVWTFVYKRSSNIEMKFRAQFPNLET